MKVARPLYLSKTQGNLLQSLGASMLYGKHTVCLTWTFVLSKKLDVDVMDILDRLADERERRGPGPVTRDACAVAMSLCIARARFQRQLSTMRRFSASHGRPPAAGAEQATSAMLSGVVDAADVLFNEMEKASSFLTTITLATN